MEDTIQPKEEWDDIDLMFEAFDVWRSNEGRSGIMLLITSNVGSKERVGLSIGGDDSQAIRAMASALRKDKRFQELLRDAMAYNDALYTNKSLKS